MHGHYFEHLLADSFQAPLLQVMNSTPCLPNRTLTAWTMVLAISLIQLTIKLELFRVKIHIPVFTISC